MIFSCDIKGCNEPFNCKKALKEHQRTHNTDRPFTCDLCDQTFTQYSSLQKHARVHDGQKPYQCDYQNCKQAFSQVSNLIRHQRIHTGDKPYQCSQCQKQFASGSNLKQHLQIHDKQEKRLQFECIFKPCDKKYLYSSSLKKHFTISHEEEYKVYLAKNNIRTEGYNLKGDNKDQKDNSHSVSFNHDYNQDEILDDHELDNVKDKAALKKKTGKTVIKQEQIQPVTGKRKAMNAGIANQVSFNSNTNKRMNVDPTNIKIEPSMSKLQNAQSQNSINDEFFSKITMNPHSMNNLPIFSKPPDDSELFSQSQVKTSFPMNFDQLRNPVQQNNNYQNLQSQAQQQQHAQIQQQQMQFQQQLAQHQPPQQYNQFLQSQILQNLNNQTLFNLQNSNNKNAEENEDVLSVSCMLKQPYQSTNNQTSLFKRKCVVLQNSRNNSLSGRGSEIFPFMGGNHDSNDFTSINQRKNQPSLFQEQSKSLFAAEAHNMEDNQINPSLISSFQTFDQNRFMSQHRDMEDLSASGLKNDIQQSSFMRRAMQSSFKPINTKTSLNGSVNLFSPRSVNSGTFPVQNQTRMTRRSQFASQFARGLEDMDCNTPRTPGAVPSLAKNHYID